MRPAQRIIKSIVTVNFYTKEFYCHARVDNSESCGVVLLRGSTRTAPRAHRRRAIAIKPRPQKARSMEPLTTGFALKLVEVFGWPALIFLIWYLTHIAENRRQEQSYRQTIAEREERRAEKAEERKERDREREEHMMKWNALIEQHNHTVEAVVKTHRDEAERNAKLNDRMAEAIELQAHLTSIVGQKIDTNQYCPEIRNRKGTPT
jgi:hypothetical protein